MISPADIIYQLLIDLALGSDPAQGQAWPVYVGFLPELPEEALCVYDTAGRLDGRLMEDGWQIEHPGIQIRCRGRTYIDTYGKIQSIARQLDNQFNTVVTWSPTEIYMVQNISRTGAILPLGLEEIDGRRCHHFTLNAVLTLKQ